MRKFFLAATAAAMLSLPALAQKEKQETLEGNGNLVTKDIPVKSFETLKATGVYELKITQGAKESVKIEADENLQELFTVRNDGNALIIEMKDLKNTNLKSKNKMRVHVTFTKITSLDLGTVGNVVAENQLSFSDLALRNQSVGNVDLNLTANKVDINNTSVGNVKLNGKAEFAVIKNSGVGSIQAASFEVQSMDIDNSGIGSATVNAAKELKVKDSFLGKVTNKGSAATKNMNKKVI
jgi:hypothetical protein